jgi:hypothetical protein
MSNVTGILRNYLYLPPNPSLHAAVVFTPSGPGVGGSSLFFSQPLEFHVDQYGGFDADLMYTTDITPKVWYTVAIQWLNGAGVPVGSDEVPGRLHVPIAGGTLYELLSLGVGFGEWWETTTDEEPEGSLSGDYIWNTTTDDVWQKL